MPSSYLTENVNRIMSVGGMFSWVIDKMELGESIPNDTYDMLIEYAKSIGFDLIEIDFDPGIGKVSFWAEVGIQRGRYVVYGGNWFDILSDNLGYRGYSDLDLIRELFRATEYYSPNDLPRLIEGDNVQ